VALLIFSSGNTGQVKKTSTDLEPDGVVEHPGLGFESTFRLGPSGARCLAVISVIAVIDAMLASGGRAGRRNGPRGQHR